MGKYPDAERDPTGRLGTSGDGKARFGDLKFVFIDDLSYG
jgi:hypothetical protein